MKSTIQYVRGLLGFNRRRVNGEVIMRGDSLQLTVRIYRDDKRTPRIYVHTVNGKLDNIDELLGKAAQHILHYNDPYVLAAYFYVQKDDRCLAEIQYTLSQEPAADDPWAYALWASILEDHKDFEGAVKKYEEANKKYKEVFQREKGAGGAEFHVSLNNWGNQLEAKADSLAESGRPEEARKMLEEALSKYNKAVELERNYELAYVGIGDVLRKLGRYKEAVESYERSIKLDPEIPYSYIGLGDVVREEKGDFEEALAKYSIAAKLSYTATILKEVNEKSAMSYELWATHLEEQGKVTSDEGVAAKLAYIYKGWGDILRNMGRNREAVSKYRRAAKLDSGLGEEVSALIHGLMGKHKRVVLGRDAAVK